MASARSTFREQSVLIEIVCCTAPHSSSSRVQVQGAGASGRGGGPRARDRRTRPVPHRGGPVLVPAVRPGRAAGAGPVAQQTVAAEPRHTVPRKVSNAAAAQRFQ